MKFHHVVLFSILILAVIPLALAVEAPEPLTQNQEGDIIFYVYFNGSLPSSSATCNTTVTDADQNIIIGNIHATNNIDHFNVSLTATQSNAIGNYIVSGSCQDQGVSQEFTFTVLVSPSGTDDNTIGQLILLSFGILFSAGFIWFGFNKQDPIFVLFGGLALISVGLYTLINGVAVYRNTLTRGISLIVLGVAGYISIRTSVEMMNG